MLRVSCMSSTMSSSILFTSRYLDAKRWCSSDQKSDRIANPDNLSYQKLTPKEMGLEEKEGKWRLKAVPDSKFYGRDNPDAVQRQFVWVADVRINHYDVQSIFDELIKRNQSVHINTGTHGDLEGKTSADSQNAAYSHSGFLRQDLQLVLQRENVSLLPISKDVKPISPERANHVIQAWCYSANRSLHEVREEAEKKAVAVDHSVQTHYGNGPQIMGDNNIVPDGDVISDSNVTVVKSSGAGSVAAAGNAKADVKNFNQSGKSSKMDFKNCNF